MHPLTRLDVFDARAIALHVDEDLTYVYTPSDLALFSFVNEAVEQIRTRLERDVKASTITVNPFVSKVQRDSRVRQKLESLGAATDLAELEQFGAVSQDEADGLDGLRERVNALRPESSADRVLQADSERRFLEQALAACKALGGFDNTKYEEARTALSVAEDKHRVATETAFAGQGIPGALGDAWRTFVAAGDAYMTATGLNQYPATGDKCLYCRQDLAASALELIQRYRDFCNNQLKKDVDAARSAMSEVVRALVEHGLTPLVAELTRRQQLFRGDRPPLLDKISALVVVVRIAQQAVEQRQSIDKGAHNLLVSELEAVLAPRLAEVKKLLGALQGQGDERKRVHVEESAKLKDLESRITVRDLLEEIRKFVKRAKWANKAQSCPRGSGRC